MYSGQTLIITVEQAKRIIDLGNLIPYGVEVAKDLPAVRTGASTLAEVGTGSLAVRGATQSVASLSAAGLRMGGYIAIGSMALAAASMALDYYNSDKNDVDIPSVPDEQSIILDDAIWVLSTVEPQPLPPFVPFTEPQKNLDDYQSSMDFIHDNQSQTWRTDLADSYLDQMATRIHNSVLSTVDTPPASYPSPSPNPLGKPPEQGGNPVPPEYPKPELPHLKPPLVEKLKETPTYPLPPATLEKENLKAGNKVGQGLETLLKEGVKIATGSGGGGGSDCLPIKLCQETLDKLKTQVFGSLFTGLKFPVTTTPIIDVENPSSSLTKADLIEAGEYFFRDMHGYNITDTIYNSFQFQDFDGSGEPNKSIAKTLHKALIRMNPNTGELESLIKMLSTLLTANPELGHMSLDGVKNIAELQRDKIIISDGTGYYNYSGEDE